MAFGPIEDESTGKQPKPVVFTYFSSSSPSAGFLLFALLPDLPMKLSNHSLFLLTFAFHILTTKPGKALFLFARISLFHFRWACTALFVS